VGTPPGRVARFADRSASGASPRRLVLVMTLALNQAELGAITFAAAALAPGQRVAMPSTTGPHANRAKAK
jgi:hypothetical protein